MFPDSFKNWHSLYCRIDKLFKQRSISLPYGQICGENATLEMKFKNFSVF
jgi:hypothetical protein